jgi:2-dehydro-3-deoxyphosphooctonate aldolase (KDO 8-P synthase)
MNFFEECKNYKFNVIAGPCVMETRKFSVEQAIYLRNFHKMWNINFCFKASFDKANRTSIESKRGLGFDTSFNAFELIKDRHEISTITDIHESWQADMAPTEILQVPAFLCRQTDLLRACAGTGKTVAVKKGQFMPPEDMVHVVQKLESFGAKEIIIIDRGTCFGYGSLIVDFPGLKIMQEQNPDALVFLDVTHSTQKRDGVVTSGNFETALWLGKAATAIGIDGLFLETHPDPHSSPSDGDCMIPHSELNRFYNAWFD